MPRFTLHRSTDERFAVTTEACRAENRRTILPQVSPYPPRRTELADLKEVGIAYALGHCPLFQGLDAAVLRAIASVTTAGFYPKGTFLFHQGDRDYGFSILLSGAVQLYHNYDAGKGQVLHVFRAGEALGEESLVSGSGCAGEARAVDDTSVLTVSKAGFLELLQRRPELGLCILRAMARQLDSLMNLIADLSLKDTRTRVVAWLLNECHRHFGPCAVTPCCIEIPVAKQVLAAELGTTSETFSRTLAKLRKLGLLEVDGRKLTLLNPAKLARLIKDNFDTHAVLPVAA